MGRVVRVEGAGEVEEARRVFEEYIGGLGVDLSFQGCEGELANFLGEETRPWGVGRRRGGLVPGGGGVFWAGVGVRGGQGLGRRRAIGVGRVLSGAGLGTGGYRRCGWGGGGGQAWIALVSMGITPAFVIAF